MGTKRLRRSRQQGQDAAIGGKPQRRARVRNRLLACVVLAGTAVLAVGTPVLLDASADLSESQELVERAETGRRVVSLSHALADERDAQVRLLAAKAPRETPEEPPGVPGTPENPGLPGQETPGQETPDAETPEVESPALPDTEDLQAKVDSRVTEVRSQLPAELRKSLDTVADQRRQVAAADGGPEDARTAYVGYTAIVQALGSQVEETARALPPRAAGTTPTSLHALPYLGRAAEQASASRGLLLAALTGGGPQPELTAAAQQARVRELAAVADFEQTAPEATRERLHTTVTGSEVTTATRYLERMTGAPRLGPAAQRFSQDRVDTNLTARVDMMRGFHSALAGAEVQRLEELRDADVTALQLRFVLVGGALLLAVAAGIYAARSMTRPLAVLRLGSARVAADPAAEEPIRFTGRNDEYAEVVHSVNRIQAAAVQLRERAEAAEADAVRHAAARKKLAAERDALREETGSLGGRLAALDGAVHGTFVQLALRNLGLTERQLSQLEALEAQENEPDQLATLFRLDHLATRMRRHGENLLLLAGAEHGTGHHPGPVPLLDVLRAAISEIERYERVELAALPPHAQVSGFAADDISHLIAELLDNATAFSPPEAEVQLSGWLLENGEVMLSVADSGIGMTTERLAELNERLGEPDKQDPPSTNGDDALGIGLYVVAKLAARHGMRVQLRVQKQGGVTAVVILPRALLPDRPGPGRLGTTTAGTGTAQALPGTVAEANSHALPGHRGRRPEAVERARRAAEGAAAAPADGAAVTPEAAAGATAPADAPVAAPDAPAAGTDAGSTLPSGTEPLAAPAADAEPAPAPDTEPAADAESAPSPTAESGTAPDAGSVPAPDAVAPAPADAESATAPAAEADTVPAPGPEPLGAPDAEPAPERTALDLPAPAPAPDDAPPAAPAAAAPAVPTTAGGRAPLARTDKGLPKRTPHITPVESTSGAVPGPRVGGARADELRRRLGGFRQGAQEGERDAAAQLAAESDRGPIDPTDPAHTTGSTGTTSTTGTTSFTAAAERSAAQDREGADEMGDTAEEARQ